MGNGKFDVFFRCLVPFGLRMEKVKEKLAESRLILNTVVIVIKPKGLLDCRHSATLR